MSDLVQAPEINHADPQVTQLGIWIEHEAHAAPLQVSLWDVCPSLLLGPLGGSEK